MNHKQTNQSQLHIFFSTILSYSNSYYSKDLDKKININCHWWSKLLAYRDVFLHILVGKATDLLNRRNSLLPTLFTMESVYHYFGPICVNLRKTAFKKSSMWVSTVSLQNQKNNTKIEIYFIYFHIYNIRCSHILYISRVIVRILDSHSTCYLSLR